MVQAPIFARFADNILVGAVITSSVAPVSTYSLTTLASMNPAARVIFGVPTVTVTFTLPGGSALGDLLCLPMHNLHAGSSPTVLTITNGAGFSAGVIIPALQADDFPPTLVVDLRAFAGTRTSNVWRLVITSNADNVVLGGAVAIYTPLRSFLGVSANSDGGVVGEFTEAETPNNLRQENEYKTPYIQEYGTVSRSVTWSLILEDRAALREIRDWFRANAGSARPSLFSPYPDEPADFSPYFGTWQDTLTITTIDQAHTMIQNVFTEWPKGLVIA